MRLFRNLSGIFMESNTPGGEYLLDTQIVLWLISGDPKLDEEKFRARFDRKEAIFYCHQVSLWEMQIKYDLKKLPLPSRPGKWLKEALSKAGIAYATISDDAIFSLGKLPGIHRDPFDRMLIAHALVNRWTVITSDLKFEEYPVWVEVI